MKTPQEWLQEVPLNERSTKWVAAIQADARTGMVPVEKAKELVRPLESLCEIDCDACRVAVRKALATAKEMGVL